MTGSQRFFKGLAATMATGFLFLGLISCQSDRKTWARFTVDTGGAEIRSLEKVDINGDRVPEIVASCATPPGLLIFQRNLDAEGVVRWQRSEHPVPGGASKTRFWKPLIEESRQPFLIVLAGPPNSSALLFPIEAAQTGASQLGEPVSLELPAASWCEVAYGDLNNDGVEDLAFAAGVENEDLPGAPVAIWLSQPVTPDSPTGRVTLVIAEVGKALMLEAEDIDQDGDIDLKIADGNTANESMGAYWLENPWPDQPGVTWKRRFITLSAAPPARGQVVDLDGDTRDDLLLPFRIAQGSNRLVGFKKIVKGGQTGWLPLPYPISGKQGKIFESQSADLDLDGFPDMILGFDQAPEPLEHLFWMKNPGDSAAPQWIRQSIAGTLGSEIRDLVLWDVDQDGDLDVMVIENDNELAWYRNPHFPLQD
jgi:hypothetical protein